MAADPRPPLSRRPHSGRSRVERRSLVVLVVLGLATLALVVMTAAFLWPREARGGGLVDVGRLDAFPPGTVTSFRIVDGRAVRVAEVPAARVQLRSGLHIVRFEDGEVRAFSWRSTHLGWAVRWRDDADGWAAEVLGVEGMFADPHGYWFIDGTVHFGPAPRNLDQFAVEITERDRVVVDLARLIPGERRPTTRGLPPTPTPVTPLPPTPVPSSAAIAAER